MADILIKMLIGGMGVCGLLMLIVITYPIWGTIYYLFGLFTEWVQEKRKR